MIGLVFFFLLAVCAVAGPKVCDRRRGGEWSSIAARERVNRVLAQPFDGRAR